MKKPSPNEGRKGVIGMQVFLECGKSLAERVRGGWNIHRIARPTPANPILALANFSWLSLGATHTTHQAFVRLVEQPHRERQPLGIAKLTTSVRQCFEVVAD